MNRLKQILPVLLSCCLVLTSVPRGFASQAEQPTTQPQVQPAQLNSIVNRPIRSDSGRPMQ
jgi:hypothetical protein